MAVYAVSRKNLSVVVLGKVLLALSADGLAQLFRQ